MMISLLIIMNTLNSMCSATTQRSIKTGTYPLDTLSSSAKTSLRGAYSVKRLFSTYTNPQIKVRNSSTSEELDFYADENGNLGTVLNGMGTSITDWLGVATGYITTWYDQSGVGNHATQTTQGSQAYINTTNKYLDFKTSRNFSLPDSTVPSGNSNYTVCTRHNTLVNEGGWVGSGNFGTNNGTNCFRRNAASSNPNGYTNYWWNVDMITTSGYATGNYLVWLYNGSQRILYINGSSYQTTSSSNHSGGTGNNTLASGGVSAEYCNGELYFVYIFSSALSASDIAVVSTN